MSQNQKNNVQIFKIGNLELGDENFDASQDVEYLFADELTEMLVESIKERPAIWDIRNIGYKNRTLRPTLWAQVVNELNLDETRVESLKKRWESLRSCYIRSKRWIPSGSGASQREYKFSKCLSFLDDTCAPRKSTSFMFEENSSPSSLSPLSNSSKSNSLKNAKTSRIDYSEKKLIEERRLLDVLTQPDKTLTDEEVTADLIARRLSKFPEETQVSLTANIFKMFVEAYKNQKT